MRPLVLSIVAVGCVEDQPAEKPAPADTEIPFVTGSEEPEPTDGSEPTLDPIVQQVVPLVGGGIAAGAEWIAAVDPDSDGVGLIHAATGAVQRHDFEVGSAPAVVAWTAPTSGPERAHVLLRGNGALAVVEPAAIGTAPTVVRLTDLCAGPRGLAWDALRETMWVACASGELVASTEEGEIVGSFWLDSDLRDVVVLDDGRAMVSRMRAAEVLIVDLDTGAVTARFAPREQPNPFERPFVPRLLRRLVPLPGVGAIALYQAHDTRVVPVTPSDQNEDESPYGGTIDCDGIVRTVVSDVSPDVGFGDVAIVDARDGYIVDLLHNDHGWPLLASATGVATRVDLVLPIGNETCLVPTDIQTRPPSVPTGLARHGDDVWVTARDPFTVQTLSEFQGVQQDLFDTNPMTLFHDSPAGIACASCHMEGGDDAHTWNFNTGERRTQALGGIRVSETAPFHWNGDLPTFEHLLADVAVGRMGFEAPSHVESDELQEFLDLLPAATPAGPPADPALVAEGAVLFGDETVGCTECHSGWRYTNGESADVGTGGELQVPSLIGVGARLPLMHDGCAQTLRQRFDDPVCGGGVSHGNTTLLTSEQIDALVAFLASL